MVVKKWFPMILKLLLVSSYLQVEVFIEEQPKRYSDNAESQKP